MGTGIITGPYAITSGQTITLNDPATWSIASATVPIQNNTGYTVYVQSAGAGYNVQPFTASTIPAAGGQTIVGVVSSTANIQTGLLTAVWLLPGQTAPIQDGPMTVFPRTITSLTITGQSGDGGTYEQISGWKPTDTTITLYIVAGNLTAPNNYWWLYSQAFSQYFGPQLSTNGNQTVVFNGLNLNYITSFYVYYGPVTSGGSGPAYVGTQFGSLTATSSQ